MKSKTTGTRDGERRGRVDRWLAEGGTVLAATERTARSLGFVHHAARRAEGRTAWLTPAIANWDSWLRERWLERNKAGLMLMNPLQEQTLWSQVIGESAVGKRVLHPRRLAGAAQQAYRLLCDYAPGLLRSPARSGWVGDAATFSEWIEAFENRCVKEGLISNSRLVLELTKTLEIETFHSSEAPSQEKSRSPLLLVGFDRLLETQKTLLDAWGAWQRDEPRQAASVTAFVQTRDSAAEIDACLRWLRARIEDDSEARLLVVATALQERRGDLERALLDGRKSDGSELDFEFSLGVPLGRLGIVRSAILLLRWLHEPIGETELDWLLTSGYCASTEIEEVAMAAGMRELRRRGRERPEWSLDEFAAERERAGAGTGFEMDALPDRRGFPRRLLEAQELLLGMPARRSNFEWAGAVAELLNVAGWPGFRPLSSAVFQMRERWERMLEDCGSLGFDGSRVEWAEFVDTFAEAAAATIFATESSDAGIQISEPLESAGLLADGIWFLGADEENWPGRGQPHPLLPIGLQRESGMPHASPRNDWELAQEATERLLTSANEIVFSYAKLSGETEKRPSRLVSQRVGKPERVEALSDGAGFQELAATERRDLTETFEDGELIPFPHAVIGGGAATLTRQSLCPFQAFAVARLGAEQWDAAESGLNAKQRGQLLHSVLHRVWGGGAQGGISSSDELQQIGELRPFVGKIVSAVMRETFDERRRNSLPSRFPRRYLELEAERLTGLVSEWLEYERERLPFTVAGTEILREVAIAGLMLKVRLDRVDRLENGKALIVDYKSSDVGPSAWAGERPDDVQLPLYATFGSAEEDLEGLVFARVRPGEAKFCGRVRDAAGTLQQGLNARNGLVKDPLTELQMEDWRERIERLGEDFLEGRAEVDPKEPGKTCESCHLHAVCRIYESQPLAADPAEAESGDEENDVGNGDA